MQFETLKLFCDIARLRSFSRAATGNGITQSAVSQTIRHLEDHLGVQLIDRSIRPLQLTEVGRRYFEDVKPLVERYLDVEAEIRGSQSDPTRHVQIAAIYSVGLRGMSQFVRRYADLYPGAQAHIECLHPERIYARVLDRTADLGLLSFPRRSRELVALPWREEEMVVVCAPSHPLSRQRSVLLSRLTGESFIHFDRNLVIRRRIDRFFHAHGVAPRVALEFDDIENIKNAVDAQAGVAILPRPTVEREVHSGTLVAVPLANARLTRPLAIIHRRTPVLSVAAARFVDLLRSSEIEPHHPEALSPRKAS